MPKGTARFTIVAISLIGVGLKGLQLGGAQQWVNDVFDGGVLLAALAVAAVKIKRAR